MNNDLNYFAPFQTGKRRRRKGKASKAIAIAPLLLSVLAAFFIVGAPLICFGYEFMLNQGIAGIQETLSVPENMQKLQTIDEKQARMDSIIQALPELQTKDQMLASVEWVTEGSLQVIKDSIPKQITMNVMSLSGTEVKIEGTALDKPAISEMEYNLRKSGLSDSLFVSTIIKDEAGALKYTVTFKPNTSAAKDVKPQ